MNLFPFFANANDPTSSTIVAVLSIIIGLGALLFGRRLFWLAVAAAGFLIGVIYGPMLFGNLPPLVYIAVALVLGLIGALLAVVLQRVMVAIAGFFGLGALGASLAAGLGAPDWLALVAFLIAGIIGAVAAVIVFDWAIIIISALLGASLIMGGVAALVAVPAWVSPVAVLVLAIIGIIFQARDLTGLPPAHPHREPIPQ